MGKVIYDISMSLDGFIAGANARPEAGWAGLGEGGERLHDWGFNSARPRNRKIMEALSAGTRCGYCGRTTYNLSILIGSRQGQWAPAYRRLSFRTLCRGTSPPEGVYVCG